MKQANDFAHDMLDLDQHPEHVLYIPTNEVSIEEDTGNVLISMPFLPFSHNGVFKPMEDLPTKNVTFTLCAYGGETLRLTGGFTGAPPSPQSVMLEAESVPEQAALTVSRAKDWVDIVDENGQVRMRSRKKASAADRWSDFLKNAYPMPEIEFFPDGKTPVRLMSYDQFFPGKLESVPLGFIGRADDFHALFSIHAAPVEHFTGTGERFARMDLSGRTITLENTDSLGVNSRKAYKNIPFYISSKGYGLFLHSTAHMRLSFADISTRSVQGRIEEGILDLFFIGGGTPDRISMNYRGLTGFSPEPSLWSYGIWLSRMSYFSAAEIESIVERLRREEYPCDVIHLDSGYFENDWMCDWKFSEKRFPNPKAFMKRLKETGIRISVWQTPNIGKENPLYKVASENGYLPPLKSGEAFMTASDFSGQDFGGQIDFTNPEAAAWYQDLLRNLLSLGVACIKTDFGEKILMNADFLGMHPALLHNVYSLLYAEAAFKVSAEFTDKPIVWSRSSWAGGQRYPIHWGGDTAATWDGMAATLRGGLHFGLSGFSFWSHDIPGFHGLPEFMNTKPSEALYMRWTQFGAFTSHMRYHGTYPREPWEYPGIAAGIRKWWRLRYALIPYLLQEARECAKSGLPMIAALLLHHPGDPAVWHIDDEYYFGRDFLAAPVMNEDDKRYLYLPAGEWVDFWKGGRITGPVWLEEKRYPFLVMPLYIRSGASVPFYPERVSSTVAMDPDKMRNIRFDHTYKGVLGTFLGECAGFTASDLEA